MEEKQMIIRIDKDLWKDLKKIALEKEISMNKLGIEAIKYIIKKYQKELDRK